MEPLQPLKEVKTKRIVKKKFPMTVTESEESRLRSLSRDRFCISEFGWRTN